MFDEEEDDFDLKSEMREGLVVSDARGGGYAPSRWEASTWGAPLRWRRR
jgi:hypothetical protein